jgi:hypothetical protein
LRWGPLAQANQGRARVGGDEAWRIKEGTATPIPAMQRTGRARCGLESGMKTRFLAAAPRLVSQVEWRKLARRQAGSGAAAQLLGVRNYPVGAAGILACLAP